MARGHWVVFDDVKAAVLIEQVLEQIGHAYRKQPSGRIEASCPIHSGTHSRQFRTTANGRGFKCFGCGAKGNVLDLVAMLEHIEVRDAALWLVEWFDLPRNAAQAPPRKSVPAGNPKHRGRPAKDTQRRNE
jgi:DNA primase